MSREAKDVVLLMGDNIYADLAPPTMTKLKAKISKERWVHILEYSNFPIFHPFKLLYIFNLYMLILEKVFKDEYETLLTHKDFPLKNSDAVVLALWDGLYFCSLSCHCRYGEYI